MNRRQFASDIDAGNKSEAEGNSGEEEGDEEDRVVAQLYKTVQGVIQLASGLLHVKLHGDEVEDDQHDTEDCNSKASLEADGIHRLDVIRDVRDGAFSSGAGRGKRTRKSTDPKI